MTRGEHSTRSGARRAASALWRTLTSLGLVIAVGSLAFGSTPTLGAWNDISNVTGTALTADVLAAPASVSVSQTCVAQATPVRRPGAGGLATTFGATAGSLTIAKPADAAVGDVLIAGIYSFGNYSATVPTAPGGWTLRQNNGANQGGQFVYTKVVAAGEPSSYTWSGLVGDASGGIAAYSGVDTVNPVNVSSGLQDSTGGSVTAPSVTTTRANVLLVGLFGLFNSVNQTPPAGTSTIWTGFSASGVSTLAVEESRPTPGATDDRVATGAGAQSIGQLIALQPPMRPWATTTWTPSASSYETGQSFTLRIGASVQRQTNLGIAIATQTDGPLVSGTGYTVDIVAGYQNWVSSAGTRSFTGLAC